MTAAGGTGSEGFSLIEALVALVVLAIATVGLIGAVEQHIDSTRAMERRAAAMWVAENRMAELTLGATGSDQVAMLGQDWQVGVTRTATDDPEIAKVRVQVSAAGEKTPAAVLDGFLDLGPREGRRS
jgi:general secretion pathway protein I